MNPLFRRLVLGCQMKILQHKIKKGPTIRFVKLADRRTTLVSFFVKTGSINDPLGEAGMAHFLEHLKLRQAKQAKKNSFLPIEARGGIANAWTRKKYTWYYILADNKDIFSAIKVLTAALITNNFSQTDIDLEKKIITEEILLTRNNPSLKIWSDWDALLYPNLPEGEPIIGRETTVSSFTIDKVMEFSSYWYRLDNMEIVVAGQITGNHMSGIIKYLTQLVNQGDEQEIIEKLARDGQIKSNEVVAEERASSLSAQATIAIGYKLPRLDVKSATALRLLEDAMGQSSHSRLYQALRAKSGAIYQIFTKTLLSADGGYQVYIFQTRRNRVGEVLTLVKKEFSNLVFDEVTINKAKTHYLGKFKRMLDDINNLSFNLVSGDLLGENSDFDPKKIKKEINKLNAKMINNVIKKYYTEENWRELVN